MIEVKVVHRRVSSQGVALLELVPTRGGELPDYTPGAHVDLHLNNGMVRQYSLCGRIGDRASYTVAVQLEPESRGGSSYIHSQVDVGSTLTVGLPRNLFSLEPLAKRVLLFAGGIGITPILLMAEHLHALGIEFTLHYCARNRARMALLDRILGTPIEESSFLHTDDGQEAQLFNAKAAIGSPSEGTHLYVCGPGGFMDHVLNTAGELGWKESHIHKESFSPQQVNDSNEQGFELHLARSGRIVKVSATQTAADALVNAGVEISIACGQGICGTCITPVLEGIPDHRDMCLSDSDHDRNDKFAPCCSRSRSHHLVLDL